MEQAIETEDTFTIESDEEVTEEVEQEGEAAEAEQPEVQAEAEDEGEFEIVVEGEEEPASKPRVSGFQKSLNRLTRQREAARTEADEERAKRELAEEEAKLWRMKAEQQSSGPPKPEDFETDEDFEAAKRDYDKQELITAAQSAAREVLTERQGQQTQTAQAESFERNLQATYEQAAELGIKAFEEQEEAVTGVVGENLLNYIVTYHGDKSAAIISHLSANPAKAQGLKDLSQAGTPEAYVRLSQRLTRLEDSLKVRRKQSIAPEPEPEVRGGGAETDGVLKGATFE